MTGVILAGGRATRLRPPTQTSHDELLAADNEVARLRREGVL